MARKVKFALILKDGYEVRNNIEEIKEHFDYNKIVDYFIDGQLSRWLEDRHYYEEIKNDVETALDFYKKAAKYGDDDAMLALGNYYIDEEWYDNACIWFSRSAEKGNSDAQNKMGEIMFQGLGRDVDLDLAFSWFEKAAKGDCAEAIYNLAQCYTYGYGVRKDLSKAKELYEKAAQCGIDDANWFLDKIRKG